MATSTCNEGDPSFFRSVKWSKALQAGLLVGAVLFLLTRGIPWVGSGMINPGVMGRELPPSQEATPAFFFGVMILHLIVSILYALIIAPIVNGFRAMIAGVVGAVVGLVLYFLNYAAFAALAETAISQGEAIPLVMHILFGLFTAEAYKGMAKAEVVPAA